MISSEFSASQAEISTYHWQEDASGNALRKPIDKNNHLIDAGRYAHEQDMIESRMEITGEPVLSIGDSMANIFSQWWDDSISKFAQSVAQYIQDPLNARYGVLANYYTGDHRPQLKVKDGQGNDNIIQNFIGLAVDRSVSRLYRGGIKFELPEGSTKQQEYIDKVWDLNKKEIILYQVGLHGADFGTCSSR